MSCLIRVLWHVTPKKSAKKVQHGIEQTQWIGHCIKTVFQVSEWENIPRIFRLECILHQASQQFLHLYAYVPILKEFLLSQGLGHKQRRKCDYQDSYTSHSLSLGIQIKKFIFKGFESNAIFLKKRLWCCFFSRQLQIVPLNLLFESWANT